MALNAYDITKDKLAGNPNAQLARYGADLSGDYSDTVDFATYQIFVVVVAGDVIFLPVINDENDPITITAAPVGMVIPWQVRRVFSTGTTATLRTFDKVY